MGSLATIGLPAQISTPFFSAGDKSSGASSWLQLNSGASNAAIPNTPDQVYTFEVSGQSGDPARDHLQLRGQASGPSPATIPIDIAPDGTVTIPKLSAGSSAGGAYRFKGAWSIVQDYAPGDVVVGDLVDNYYVFHAQNVLLRPSTEYTLNCC